MFSIYIRNFHVSFCVDLSLTYLPYHFPESRAKCLHNLQYGSQHEIRHFEFIRGRNWRDVSTWITKIFFSKATWYSNSRPFNATETTAKELFKRGSRKKQWNLFCEAEALSHFKKLAFVECWQKSCIKFY